MKTIAENNFYKKVLSESFGGVMYNVANLAKYKTENTNELNELLALWDSLSESQQSAIGGIAKGAMSFLNGR